MRCAPMLQLGLYLGAPIPVVHSEAPMPMAMPGSPGATTPVAVLALLARLWAWWDKADGEVPAPT